MRRINQKRKKEALLQNKSLERFFSKSMIECMDLFSFEKNEYLCRQGEEMLFIIILVVGRTKVYTTLENGKSLLLCFYEGIEVIGDAEILSEKCLASSTVQAVEEGYCLGISFEVVKNKFMEDLQFFQYITANLSRKLLRLSTNSSINLLYPLENRLASYLVGVSGGENEKIEVNLTELSELLGASYRHLLRMVKSFSQKKYIKKEGNSIVIYNLEKLQKLGIEVYR